MTRYLKAFLCLSLLHAACDVEDIDDCDDCVRTLCYDAETACWDDAYGCASALMCRQGDELACMQPLDEEAEHLLHTLDTCAAAMCVAWCE